MASAAIMQNSCINKIRPHIFMKSFSHFLLLFILAGSLSVQTNLTAAETTYAGNLKGIECTECKRNIAKALGKIKGVKTISIVKQSNTKHRLEVITDGSVVITKVSVVDAISGSEHYRVTNWRKKRQ